MDNFLLALFTHALHQKQFLCWSADTHSVTRSRIPATKVASGELKAGIHIVNRTNFDLPLRSFVKNLLFPDRNLTFQGSLFSGSNLKQVASSAVIGCCLTITVLRGVLSYIVLLIGRE